MTDSNDYNARVRRLSPNNLENLIYWIETQEGSSIAEYCAPVPKGFADPRLLAGGKEKFALLPPKIQYDQMQAFMDNVTTILNQHTDPSNWNDADRSKLESTHKFIKETSVPWHIAQGGADRWTGQDQGSEGDEFVQWMIDEITIESVASAVVEFAMEQFQQDGLIIPGYDYEQLRNVQYGSGHIASLMFFGIASYEPCGGSSSTQHFLSFVSELFEDC